jgi:CBS domain-containing protein
MESAMDVKEILQFKDSNLFTVSPDDPLSDAVIMMDTHNIAAIVVTRADEVVGMLTFREVIAVLAKRLSERYAGPTLPIAEIFVREAMHVNPPTAHLGMDVDELRNLMILTQSGHVPVLDGKKLVSVLSLRDVAKAVLAERNFENKLLKAYIKDWPEKAEES